MKKIGLYFGSFNPVTTGHMLVAQESLEHVDEVWFILSPHNPHKDEKDLLDENSRYEMLVEALVDSDNPRFKASTIEFDMDKPSYTINTIDALKEKHKDVSFHIITGTDAYMTVTFWKKGVDLLQQIPFIIVKRGYKDDFNLKDSDIVIDGYSTMSATVVRNKVKNNKPLGYLVPGGVENLIKRKGYYKD
mgnify:CR=1 FL=1